MKGMLITVEPDDVISIYEVDMEYIGYRYGMNPDYSREWFLRPVVVVINGKVYHKVKSITWLHERGETRYYVFLER